MMSQNCASGATDFDTDGTTNSTVLGFVIHKSCLHIAFSQRARLQSQYDVDHLGTKVVADAVLVCWVGILKQQDKSDHLF